MPAKNTLKVQVAQSYYHVYARGLNKQKLFVSATDYQYFLGLFNRYLSPDLQLNPNGEPYPNFHTQIDLLAYCLMGNHFHLLVYQYELPALEKYMRSLMTSYARYFNLKYNRTGPLYESRYKAVRVDNETYLQHISRYIHLNPRHWQRYKYSSLAAYRDASEPDWLTTKPVLDLFDSRVDYLSFVADYEAQRDMLAELKHQLADEP